MNPQNLKAEVELSPEPDRDPRAHERNHQATGHAEESFRESVFSHRVMQSLQDQPQQSEELF